MSWAGEGLSCLSAQSQAENWHTHKFLCALLWLQCCPASGGPGNGNARAGITLGLASLPAPGLLPGHFIQPPHHGLAHWPSLSLPGIDFLTPGTRREPDFYHPIKTAALRYFSSCIPRIRPHDGLKQLSSWPDFKCACHDHLPLKLRTCLSVKCPVHPWWKTQTDGFGLEKKKFKFQMCTEAQGQIPGRDRWGHGKVQKPLVNVGSLIKELRVIMGEKWFMKSWIRKWVSDADSFSSNDSEWKGCSLTSESAHRKWLKEGEFGTTRGTFTWKGGIKGLVWIPVEGGWRWQGVLGRTEKAHVCVCVCDTSLPGVHGISHHRKAAWCLGC